VEERAAIVVETYEPGATVAGVAHKHGMSATRLSTWWSAAKRKALRPAAGFADGVVTPDTTQVPHDGVRDHLWRCFSPFAQEHTAEADCGYCAASGAVLMIIPSPAVRIVIATKPVDFRKGHDGLAALAERDLGLDPHSGVIIVFRAKRGDWIKVLLWDGSGMVMSYKRLEDGKFAWPKISDGVMRLSKAQFEALFEGLDWRRVTARRTRRPGATE
jgi:transposase